MKTLIIHPKDRSTHFLDIVYNGIDNKTVVTGGMTRKKLVSLIRSHDQIMMMGHGSPSGLFCVGEFPDTFGFVIDSELADLLAGKQNLYIWCYASDFVHRHRLQGYTTGMFISEVDEAMWCGVVQATQEMVDESNYCYVRELGTCKSIDQMLSTIVDGEYQRLAKTNPVARYNHNLLVEANRELALVA